MRSMVGAWTTRGASSPARRSTAPTSTRRGCAVVWRKRSRSGRPRSAARRRRSTDDPGAQRPPGIGPRQGEAADQRQRKEAPTPREGRVHSAVRPAIVDEADGDEREGAEYGRHRSLAHAIKPETGQGGRQYGDG